MKAYKDEYVTNILGVCLVTMAMVVAMALTSCSPSDQSGVAGDDPNKIYRWKLVTAWPKNFPGIGVGPENFARAVEKMSKGRLRIKVYAGGELVPPLEVFDAVSRGVVEMGHTGAYYDKGKIPAAQFFAGMPFGFTSKEMDAWLHYAGGIELFEKIYGEHNILPIIGGNTSSQMFGWFNKELRSVRDLRGLRIRIPGIAGDVLSALGAQVVTLPGGELYTAMQTGVIDAAEWISPYNDLAIGLHEVAKYYYYPAWHEPGSSIYYGINRDAWDELPPDLQEMVRVAARATGALMTDEYTARNGAALKEMVERHGVDVRALPASVIDALRRASQSQLRQLVDSDAQAREVYESISNFMEEVGMWHDVSEKAYLNIR